MSEDILVRAKRVEYPDSALRILPELIAEVERLQRLMDVVETPACSEAIGWKSR